METIGMMPLEQTVTVGQALLTGLAMGLYYDVFRIIRRIIHCGYASILAQDLFFWVTSAVGVFFVCIWCTGGTLRIIFVLAVLAGWGMYAATAGAVLMTAVEFAAGLFRGFCGRITEYLKRTAGRKAKTIGKNGIFGRKMKNNS